MTTNNLSEHNTCSKCYDQCLKSVNQRLGLNESFFLPELHEKHYLLVPIASLFPKLLEQTKNCSFKITNVVSSSVD